MISSTINEQLNDIAIEKHHLVEMMFYPKAWQSPLSSSYSWKKTNFPPDPRKKIPKEPGVYIFVVSPPHIFDFKSATALFYIGKATNLYERIGEYISERGKDLNRTKRPHVWKMINRWEGHLMYFYTTTSDVKEAEQLEDEMIRCFSPPFNKKLDAETSSRRRAF